MPIHDWTRVSAGIYYDFHVTWIPELKNTLNKGLLPPDYYALAEQDATDIGPDVLTLHVNGHGEQHAAGAGPTTVAVAPPKVRFTAQTEMDYYAQKRRSLVIRHSSDDQIIAIIEILSPGNKAGRHAFRAFIDKAVAALQHGYHLLLVDLFPPTARDPQGIHGAIWSELTDDSYRAPADKPLTLVAYAAGPTTRAYVEPVALADELPDMPLFLDAQSYVSVPLGKTYQTALEGVPRRWRDVLEGKAQS
jgi:Protein of unknown function (DUF4058)